MALSKGQQLTEQFYQWELRGRGWLRAEGLVHLEPPFHPFYSHKIDTPYIDDGSRSTLLSSIADVFRTPKPPPDSPVHDIPAIEPFRYDSTEEIEVIGISFPRETQLKSIQMEQLYVMLSHCSNHLSFEIIATHEAIVIQLAYHDSDGGYIQSQLQTFFPTCTIHHEDRLQIHDEAVALIDFGLQQEFMRPLGTGGFDTEPLLGLFAILEHLQPNESITVQVLFAPTINTWSESIINSVSDGYGGSFFLDDPDMPILAAEKVSRPLYAVTIRAMTQAPVLERAFTIINSVSNALITASSSKYNSLIGLTDAGYDIESRVSDMMYRTSHRLGMLLNTHELATLAHFPSPAISSRKLQRDSKATKAAPHLRGTYILGTNIHQGVATDVALSDEMRLKHIHIIGGTGMGKSTLLQNLIFQDITQGNGIAVLDPHGDLIDSILAIIPPSRINDVVLIDPFDSEYPVGFNILKAHSDIEKELLSTDLVGLFRRFSTSWGDQMNSVLANAIMAFVESSKGGTLIDLRRFLIEKPFRDQFLETVHDEAVVYYWKHEYPLLKGTSLGSILTRLDAFLRPKLIRNMVSQKKGLDFEQIMDSKKIVLVKLSEGLIGAENSFLLGAFMMAKLQQTAMARQVKSLAQRTPFYCYIDEFHHFISPSMSAILSGGRKYGLGLVLCHQGMEQVSKYDAELASSLLSNAGTRICFRMGDDAKKFQDGFSYFTAADLQNLDTGEAIARIGRAEDDFNLRVIPLSSSALHNAQEHIIAASREQYATKIEQLDPTVYESDTRVQGQSKPEAIPSRSTPQRAIETIPVVPEILQYDVAAIEQKQQEREHRYLQTLIKKIAEGRGYKAEIEMPVQNGKIDVALSRDTTRIACEISVTTTTEWEIHNIQKCLAAGYTSVVWCSTNKTALRNMREHLQHSFTESERSYIHIIEPDQLLQYLDTFEKPITQAEKRIRGYRVNVSYESLSHAEREQKSMSVSRIVREAIGRKQ